MTDYLLVACVDDPALEFLSDLAKFIGICDRARYLQEEQAVRYLSAEELERAAQQGGRDKPEQRTVTTTQYARSAAVAELARRRANGRCELCEEPAPFQTAEGKPFLECHHIVHLSQGGKDTRLNAVGVCPNCHRRMHVLDRLEDRSKLFEQARRPLP
jgi:5-methylcytosine-specific restriction protein A